MKKNILFNFRGGIGDFIMATPLLKNLKKNPEYRLIFIGTKEVQKLVESYDYFDELIYFNCPGPEKLKYYLLDTIKLYFKLRSLHFDVCINPITSYGKILNLITEFSNAPIRVGFNHPQKPNQYTHGLNIDVTKHDIDLNLEILKYLKIPYQKMATELLVASESINKAKQFLFQNQAKKIIGIAPLVKGMKGYAARTWPLNQYAELANKFFDVEDYHIIMFGSPDEIHQLKNSSEFKRLKENKKLLFFPSAFSLHDSIALLKYCSLLVCNDGGILHMAAALDVPIVSIWGPTTPERKGYLWKNNFVALRKNNCECLRDYHLPPVECSEPKCFNAISVEEVFETCLDMIKHKETNIF